MVQSLLNLRISKIVLSERPPRRPSVHSLNGILAETHPIRYGRKQFYAPGEAFTRVAELCWIERVSPPERRRLLRALNGVRMAGTDFDPIWEDVEFTHTWLDRLRLWKEKREDPTGSFTNSVGMPITERDEPDYHDLTGRRTLKRERPQREPKPPKLRAKVKRKKKLKPRRPRGRPPKQLPLIAWGFTGYKRLDGVEMFKIMDDWNRGPKWRHPIPNGLVRFDAWYVNGELEQAKCFYSKRFKNRFTFDGVSWDAVVKACLVKGRETGRPPWLVQRLAGEPENNDPLT